MSDEIQLENYTESSLDFILNESQSAMSDTISAYRENTNKSYAALGVYSSILSFLLAYSISNEQSDASIFIILYITGLLYSCYILLPNLKPGSLFITGTSYTQICHPFYETDTTDEDQAIHLKIARIKGLDEAIKGNLALIMKQVSVFNYSLTAFLLTTIIVTIAFGLFG